VEEGRGRAVDWRQWWWAGGRKDRAVDGSCHEFATQSICWCNVQWNRLVLERSSGAGLIAWIRNRRRRVWNSAENRMVEGRVLHTRVQEWSARPSVLNNDTSRPNHSHHPMRWSGSQGVDSRRFRWDSVSLGDRRGESSPVLSRAGWWCRTATGKHCNEITAFRGRSLADAKKGGFARRRSHGNGSRSSRDAPMRRDPYGSLLKSATGKPPSSTQPGRPT
jgi:hypothetical protein